ncbi:MAG: 4-hydroxy-3-methylbut-2-enyl diphosphate reductase [Candidatus Zixiibacteriota bacterium]|nr:MAG: 4-hydroxy-3-methylbut-2-enyl diphosphate reductase [candidate division Zixibacteria bacterium]
MLKKIIIARNYGFCMGVKRAIKIAEETSASATERVTILNEIVHNEAVVERFRKEGLGQALNLDDVTDGTLIISAHGVAPDIIEKAEAKGLNVINATCPLVTRIYDIIRRLVANDYYVIHFGDPNHDETRGVVGHAADRITVVSSSPALDELPAWPGRNLALTTQTTSSMKEALEFRDLALKKWPDLEVFDTICNATNRLQSAVVDLAPHVDMILVVGSTTSANSKRLASIANALCGRGILIGSAVEIDERWFTGADGIRTVGISAGASTPEFLVEAVIKCLVDISGGTAEVVQQERIQ